MGEETSGWKMQYKIQRQKHSFVSKEKRNREERCRGPEEGMFLARDSRDDRENFLMLCPAHSRCLVHKTRGGYSFHCCSHFVF